MELPARGIPGQRHEAWLALQKKDPRRIARNLEHMHTTLKAKPGYMKKGPARAQADKRRSGHLKEPLSGAQCVTCAAASPTLPR